MTGNLLVLTAVAAAIFGLVNGVIPGDYFPLYILAGFVLIIYFRTEMRQYCNRCNRKWARQRTGESRQQGPHGEEYEWKCKYCGHSEWFAPDPEESGGG